MGDDLAHLHCSRRAFAAPRRLRFGHLRVTPGREQKNKTRKQRVLSCPCASLLGRRASCILELFGGRSMAPLKHATSA